MKILSAEQIREADRYTIQNRPIASIDLMEAAASAWVETFLQSLLYSHRKSIIIVCGPGNNGGDGLAIARMLKPLNNVTVYLMPSDNYSPDNLANQQRLRESGIQPLLLHTTDILTLPPDAVLIDALYGSGLNRPLTGLSADIVRKINASGVPVAAVDLPSGMFADSNDLNTLHTIVKASLTITFHLPKLALLMMPTGELAGEIKIVNIGLDSSFIDQQESPHHLQDADSVKVLYRPRSLWMHKGQAGRGLLIGGIGHTAGAVLLASSAALRSGIGLLYTACGLRAAQALPVHRPEAIALDLNETDLPDLVSSLEPDAIAIGPGLGTSQASAELLNEILEYPIPTVLDADALNLIAKHRWLHRLGPNHLITPHPKEALRLFGQAKPFEFHQNLLKFSQSSKTVIAFKGRFTRIYTPEGIVWFNNSGNHGMATAGSGDVLTGVLLALLAAGYPVAQAARLGVWLHGAAGDAALLRLNSPESLIAGDIINHLHQAFHQLSSST